MATLGNATTPSSGFFFDDVGNSQWWSNYGTMPTGGGVVTDLYVFCAGDGSTPTAQLVLWDHNAVLWASGNITLPSGSRTVGGQSWQHVSVPNVFFAGGEIVNLGLWTTGTIVWTFESSGNVNFQRSVTTGPTTLSSGGTEGSGNFGAYILYTPGGTAYANTGTPAAPVWTSGGVPVVNTGTPAAPVWTPGSATVNTGTAPSPIWTPGA